MEERIAERLKTIGYDYNSEAEGELLAFEMKRGEEYILACCNLSFLPAVLEGIYIDFVCGNFLRARLYGGFLSEEASEAIVSKITEGDVTVEYAADKELSAHERLELVLKRLSGIGTELIAARRMKW